MKWSISYKDWVDTRKPVEESLAFVLKDIDPAYVWSEVWCDDMQTIVPNIHFVNADGYVVTEVSHDEK